MNPAPSDVPAPGDGDMGYDSLTRSINIKGCDSQPQHLGTQYLAVLSPHNYLTLHYRCHSTLPASNTSSPVFHRSLVITPSIVTASRSTWMSSTLPASNTSSPVFHRSLVITPSIVTASRSTWVHNIWLCSLRTITSPCIIDVTLPSPPPTLPHQSFIVPSSSLPAL
ncbi:hypothetical protein J6590_042054 [Homalodisca vitripennis]|nr:hypothetical protein J6590_042054 [Homalodisca vitripennis]